MLDFKDEFSFYDFIQSKLLPVCIFFLICIFGVRLWYLQIYKGKEFVARAKQNKSKHLLLHAPRGSITDVNGRILASTKPSYAISIVREDVGDINSTIAQISQWSGEDFNTTFERYLNGRKRVKSFDEQIIATDIPFETVARIEAQSYKWPGVSVRVLSKRFYPEGNLFAHIIGYVRQADENDMDNDPELQLGDYVGKQGVEAVLEKRLRGDKGSIEYQVDAHGRQIKIVKQENPRKGEDIALSIDWTLQQQVKQIMGQHVGAAIVLDADTGKLLVLVSLPDYDVNDFVGRISPIKWQKLREDTRKPLQNRAIQSMYPPGSVIKPIMAAIGLEDGVINTSDTVFCNGSYSLGPQTFRCWKHAGHGRVNLHAAIQSSCDVYFYELGNKLGINRIQKGFRDFGIGRLTGVELTSEQGKFVPTPEWKRKRFKQKWLGGDTVNLSIGQGFLLITPLQMARAIATLINGGKVLNISILRDKESVVLNQISVGIKDLHVISNAMIDTANVGTAHILAMPGIIIGGKTGTAQVVKLRKEYMGRAISQIPYEKRDHAWMVSFAQYANRKYVVVVMVEHGGGGSSTAGPLVRDIYRNLFSNVFIQETIKLAEGKKL